MSRVDILLPPLCSSFRRNEIHVPAEKYRAVPPRPFSLLQEISGIRLVASSPRLFTLPKLSRLDIRLFTAAALDAPIRFDRSSIKTVSQL